MSTEYPKKYWWLVLIVVPIVVAVIGLLNFSPKNVKEDGDTIIIAGSQFNGDVAFNSVNIVADQVRQTLSNEVLDKVGAMLRQAMDFVQSRQFEEAIPLLQSAAAAAPVPALFNNLGAAYMASGDLQKAAEYFEKARIGRQDNKTTAFNLNQIQVLDNQAKGSNELKKGAEEELTAKSKSVAKSAISTIVVKALTLDALPEIAEVRAAKPGGVYYNHDKVQSSKQMGKAMIVPPGKYDIWYDPADGSMTQLMAKNLEVPDRRRVTLDPNRLVSAIVVNNPGIEGLKLKQLDVAIPGGVYYNHDTVQIGKKFGKPMLVYPGRYEIWLTPDGGQTILLVKEVVANPGEIVVVGDGG